MPVTKEERKSGNWEMEIVPQTACAKAQRGDISVSVYGTCSTVCPDQRVQVVSGRGIRAGRK